MNVFRYGRIKKLNNDRRLNIKLKIFNRIIITSLLLNFSLTFKNFPVISEVDIYFVVFVIKKNKKKKECTHFADHFCAYATCRYRRYDRINPIFQDIELYIKNLFTSSQNIILQEYIGYGLSSKQQIYALKIDALCIYRRVTRDDKNFLYHKTSYDRCYCHRFGSRH